jgi:ADP-heptose:LPS heptosyltransferase
MELSVYKDKWLGLKQDPCPEELSRLSRQVAFSFIDRYYQDGSFGPEYIDLLCEIATSFSDMKLNNLAASALFEIIVEELCDDYEEMPVEIYSRVMSQVITYCRNIPTGTELDKRLTNFGISSFEELNHRSNFVHSRQYKYDIDKPPEKIILLSRVTIGADVAILSVIIQRLTKIFPHAEIVIIGSNKLAGIFGGNSGVRIHPLNYARRGGLFERFSSWHVTSDILSEEMPLDSEENILLIDPDSRITQLGVLPLSHHDNYLFFNSRKCDSTSKNARMAELANRWIDTVFGVSGFSFPKIWTLSTVSRQARNLTCSIKAAGCKKIITMNFGVGNNPRKRLDLNFETKLLKEILKSPQTVVLLDRGFGEDELTRSDSLISYLRDQGHQTANARLGDAEYPGISHGIIGVECSIGEIAALIAECDEFIGYDSACQHIAAAAQTPTLTIFAGSNNKSFIRRWSACGNTQCNIVHVNTLTDPRHIDTDETVQHVMEERTTTIRLSPQHRRKILEIKTPQRKGKTIPRKVDS